MFLYDYDTYGEIAIGGGHSENTGSWRVDFQDGCRVRGAVKHWLPLVAQHRHVHRLCVRESWGATVLGANG